MSALVRNLQTRVELLQIAGHSFPMTVNDGGTPGNCYICDPTTGYIDYGIEETRHFVANPLLQKSLIGLIRATGPLLRRTGLDRAVQANNWLFSTNPAPRIEAPLAHALRDQLSDRFPSHAVVLRSLNTHADRAALSALDDAGFVLLPSRQVYVFDGAARRPLSRDMKSDQRLLRTTDLERGAPKSPEDYARCIALYEMLYLRKYTPLNPQYTADFLFEMDRAGVLHVEVLRTPDGEIVGFGARAEHGRTLTQPLLGYDLGRPQKDGLYRLITAMAQQEASARGLLFNMSAGAAGFKRHRLAAPAIEYSAVYVDHLPRRQRIAVRTVAALLTRIGVPLLKRYKL